MTDLTENQKIEEFKTEITKTIINLIENHIIICWNYVIVENLKSHYNMLELCDCGEFNKIIRLLTNIKAFLKSVGQN